MYQKYIKDLTATHSAILINSTSTEYENIISEEGFTIEFISNTSESNYTAEEQLRIAKEVKSSLINRAVKHITTFADIRSLLPALKETPVKGTGIFTKELTKNCLNNHFSEIPAAINEEYKKGYSLTCQDAQNDLVNTTTAMFIEKFATATTKANFKAALDVEVTEEVKGVSYIDRVKAVTFTPQIAQ
ncbi:hypothetical protein [Spartinivicinus poritis]|uniref:Uncharacterized protein n=1 Tax=Spartinivicinus poritis TaxID=2994640 RepID=A0ABT5UFP8_9GAMM|nr:hypothetical protein [Spartinivicinus sp. A2-2]MDE1465015.1 hypothetical protein [Spartinivicinus sp. A2-2]